MDKETPFVRQNTPHPKELKLKAHKLFAKEKSKLDESGNLDTLSEEVSKMSKLFSKNKCQKFNECFFVILFSHHQNHHPEKQLLIQRRWIIFQRHEPKLYQ